MSSYESAIPSTIGSRGPKKSLKRRLRDYLSRKIDQEEIIKDKLYPIAEASSPSTFNHSYQGWMIKLHKANGGHVVEAWRTDDSGPYNSSRIDRELFMVRDDEDMGKTLNDILIQLMLRS
jgi:hypothetical protein